MTKSLKKLSQIPREEIIIIEVLLESLSSKIPTVISLETPSFSSETPRLSLKPKA